jgi:hypothetical protein
MTGGSDLIKNISWSKKHGDHRFVTQSSKLVKFWHPADVTKRLCVPGVFGAKTPAVLLNCVTMDNEGWCYTGGAGGCVYVWSDACTVVKQIKVSNE